MSTVYTYDIPSTFPQGLNTAVLERDVSDAISKFSYISLNEPDVSITFTSALTAGEETTLDSIITNHDPNSKIFDTHVILSHIAPSGTNGGDFSSGSWVTRPLNFIKGELTRKWASLSSNQITLTENHYVMGANCVVGTVGVHQLRFINISTGVAIYGTTSQGNSAIVQGSFTVPAEGGTYELQHRCTIGETGTGFGVAAGFGTQEIYTTMRITQAIPSL